jgi:diphthine-ammonia ligase
LTVAAISWSAGKDSTLALLRARDAGFDVRTFLTMMNPDGSSKSHGLSRELIAAQVASLGGTWRAAEASQGEYGEVFARELERLHLAGHTHMVFGDIDLQAHREWLEPTCERAGLQAVFPLWGLARAEIAREIIGRGIRARVVCVDTRWLDESHCGVEYNAGFLTRLPEGACPCGEDGEFHTFVWDGPGFSRALPLAPGVQRRVASQPPSIRTELVFQAPMLMMRA